MPVVLAELRPYDPVLGTEVIIRASSHDDARCTSLSGQPWLPALTAKGKLTRDLFDATFSGKASSGFGSLGLALSAFPNAARYTWGDKPAKLYVGNLGDDWGSYDLLFDGLTASATGGGGKLDLPLRVNDAWFDAPLLTYYAGTGGIEGGAELKGIAKPLAIGAPRFIEPICVDRTNNVYQYHAYGPSQGVAAALDSLVRFSASIGDYPDYASLVAAAIPRGRWGTCVASGLVRFGAPPSGVVSLIVGGDSGTADGWLRTAGRIINRLASLAGATPTQIDAASLAALDAAVPRNRSLYLRDQKTARDVIQAEAAACNAVAGIDWLGRLSVTRATIGGPAMTLRTDGAALPPCGEPQLLDIGSPYWRMQMGADRAWRQHATSEIAFYAALIDLGDYAGATTYREGNIVRQPLDGCRYLYTNPAPTSGNAPPNDTYWSLYEAAPTAEIIGVEPGATAGATIGTDLKNPDGSVAAASDVLNSFDKVPQSRLVPELLKRIEDIDASVLFAFATANRLNSDTQITIAQARQELGARLGVAEASVISEQLARVTSDFALAQSIAQVNANYAGFAGLVSTEAQARSDGDSATAHQIDLVSARLDNLGGSGATVEARVAAINQARVDGDSANASSITQVSARLDSVSGTGASVETMLSAAASDIDGLQAEFKVRVQGSYGGRLVLAGIAAGISGSTSEVAFLADQFVFADPSDPSSQAAILHVVGGELVYVNSQIKALAPGNMAAGATGTKAVAYDENATSFSSTSGWSDIFSISLTPAEGYPVEGQFTVSSFAGSDTKGIFQIVRDDGTVVFGANNGFREHVDSNGTTITVPFVDVVDASRATTWTLQGKKLGNTTAISCENRFARVEENPRATYQSFSITQVTPGTGPGQGTGGGGDIP